MQLATFDSTLRAKKSWFFLDDEVVCLGADINSTDGNPIHTTVENRRLSTTGNESLTIDGTPASTSPGGENPR
jgi:hyaluronate lyase